VLVSVCGRHQNVIGVVQVCKDAATSRQAINSVAARVLQDPVYRSIKEGRSQHAALADPGRRDETFGRSLIDPDMGTGASMQIAASKGRPRGSDP